MFARRSIIGLVVALLLTSVASVITDRSDAATPPADAGRLIIGVHSMLPISKGLSLFGGTVHAVSPQVNAFVLRAADLDDAEERARMDPNVRYVERDFLGEPPYTPNDPLLPQQRWGEIGAVKAWDATRGNQNILIGMIDTGHWPGHEEFQEKERFVPGVDFFSNDQDPDDECDHGTPGTSILAGGMNNG